MMDDEKRSHAERLSMARKKATPDLRNAVKAARSITSVATPTGSFSLLREMNGISDMPFIAAMMAAMLKDILDLVTFETVVLPILFAGLCSIFIFMMLLLAGANEKRKNVSKFGLKIVAIVAGFFGEFIPGLGLLPMETATVLIIYVMTLIERRDSAK